MGTGHCHLCQPGSCGTPKMMGQDLSIPKGLVSQARVAGSPSQCLPPRTMPTAPSAPCSPCCTSGLSGAAAGSRWRVGSACGTAGSAAHAAGGCCWAGRALCTARAAPSPAPHYTCRKRCGVQQGHGGPISLSSSRGSTCLPSPPPLSEDQHGPTPLTA